LADLAAAVAAVRAALVLPTASCALAVAAVVTAGARRARAGLRPGFFAAAFFVERAIEGSPPLGIKMRIAYYEKKNSTKKKQVVQITSTYPPIFPVFLKKNP
jgi:hypothetical protein